MMKHKLTPNYNYLQKSFIFACGVVYSNKDMYAKRKQTNLLKIINDIAVGKYAEFMVADHLGCDAPDTEVYDKENKSFDADLHHKGYDIHVKSSVKSFSLQPSWVFQPEDSLVTNPKKKDVLALCVVNSDGSVEFSTIKASKVIDKYRPPRKEHLNKKVLYHIDVYKLLR